VFDTAQLLEDCQKAAGTAVGFASDDELFAGVKDLAAARAAFDAAELHLLGELESRGACDRQFGSGTATWVAHETGADRRTVATRVRVASKLRHPLATVGEALAAGTITFDHARALAESATDRIVDELAAEQGAWVAKASDRSFKVWRGELQWRADLLDQDGPFDPDRELARNAMSITALGSDGVMFKGELAGAYAVGFRQLLEAKAGGLFRLAVSEHAECPELKVPTTKTLLALAMVELLRLGVACDRETTPGPVVDLMLVWNVEHPEVVESLDGDFKLAFERFSELFCDSLVTPMTINGVPLDLGRGERRASRAQRRALIFRDGGCVFPGCGAPAGWCDAHHVIHWHHDGPTDICNLALLCRHHHGVTHRRGWTMTATADQRFIWTTPEGRTLHSQRHRGKPPPGG
jgi:Domain of unknown function (DUF222)